MVNAIICTAGAWDLGSFLTNATSVGRSWGGLLLILIGVVAVVAAGVLFVKGLFGKAAKGQQATPVSWVAIFLLLIVGGALITGGFNFVANISSGGQATIEALGTGSGIWMLGL